MSISDVVGYGGRAYVIVGRESPNAKWMTVVTMCGARDGSRTRMVMKDTFSSVTLIEGKAQELGCAFRRKSARFRRNLAKRHRQERNVKVQSTRIHYKTILVILVHSGWYLSTRFLQVEKVRTYSK